MQRRSMQRTTSMTEFTLDAPLQPSDHFKDGGGLDKRLTASAAISPRNHRRNSGDLIETAHFLRSCSLCDRRLVPSHDIYMYKGNSAFCSLECRQQQMNQDESREKCSLASKKRSHGQRWRIRGGVRHRRDRQSRVDDSLGTNSFCNPYIK